MEASGTFNRLAQGLTIEERYGLLGKLNSQTDFSKEPLYQDTTAEGQGSSVEEKYALLPWYYHLLFLIIAIFRGCSPVKIYEDRLVADAGRAIDAEAPGFYDYRQRLLLPDFHSKLAQLKEGARFFYTALDSSVNRDKGAFFVFLGSLEMGDLHRILTDETSPKFLAGKNPGADDMELRRIAIRIMEESFEVITEEQRSAMYHNARSLYCLRELSAFLFDRVLVAFAENPVFSGPVCSAPAVKDRLILLNNILFSMKKPPAMTLLESMFIFILQEQVENPGFDINEEICGLLVKAERALIAVRDFNKHIPLTRILRCADRNMSLVPKSISGGEDWFAIYRDCWRRQIEAQYAEYMRDRRYRELEEAFRDFFHDAELSPLSSLASDTNSGGFPLDCGLRLSFLLGFYSQVFIPELNKVLRTIVLDGEFVNRENRVEFTETYNAIMKIEESINKFDGDLSPGGDLGRRYTHVSGEITALQIKRRRVQLVLEEAAAKAEGIITETSEAIGGMIALINGILKRETSGKYNTLRNFTQLAGKGNEFVLGLQEAAEKCQKALDILKSIEAMEAVNQ